MVVQRSPTGFVLRDPVLARALGATGAASGVALPLPFTPAADVATVVAHLQRNNPTRTVRFDNDDALDARA